MTTTTIRPDVTVIGADLIVGGAGSEHAATSDDSDTTGAQYDVDSVEGTILGFGTHTLAAGEVFKQFRGRARLQAPGGNTTIGFRFSLGSLNPPTLKADMSPAVTSTAATFATSYTAGSVTQANIDSAGLTITAAASTNDVVLIEAYIDLVTVTQPAVAVDAVSPDPYTASTIVPISWVNTLDSDGGGQTRYEVKVFTDAQYGAGGFDPDTSTPFYTSDVVISSATTADAGPLPNDTYRAYVRTAQTVNGVAHWSDWDFDEFTVTVTTSDVDTVVLTPSDSTGSISVAVNRDTGSEAWDFVEVQSSIDGGTTWVNVRGSTYVAPDAADLHTAVDYEIANGQTVKYRARATRIVSTLPITGAWVESSTDSWSSTDPWLKAPNASGLNTTFRLAARDPYRRSRRSGVFPVLGAAAPVVVSDVRSTRSGTLTVETLTAAAASALGNLLDGSAILLVQYPASMDIDDAYVAVTSDSEVFALRTADDVVRIWELDYVEVDAPADPDAGSS